MSEVAVCVSIALAFVTILLWLMRPSRNSAAIGRSSHPPVDQSLENFVPRHYHFFPQIRQALSSVDEQYLREAAPPHVARQALRERRAVARQFLAGLREDFRKLERLTRVIAALSPVISREQETERFFLGLRFHFLYGLVWMRLSGGRLPLQQIEQLTGLVGRLAVRMEQAMSEVNALSSARLPRGLSA
jgi:hypothetical protein